MISSTVTKQIKTALDALAGDVPDAAGWLAARFAIQSALDRSAVAPKRAKKGRLDPGAHHFGCVCSPSCQRYTDDPYAAMIFGTHPPPMTPSSSYNSDAVRGALTNCACGHAGDKHAEDEIGNLLKCKYCACDHFHYGPAAGPYPIAEQMLAAVSYFRAWCDAGCDGPNIREFAEAWHPWVIEQRDDSLHKRNGRPIKRKPVEDRPPYCDNCEAGNCDKCHDDECVCPHRFKTEVAA